MHIIRQLDQRKARKALILLIVSLALVALSTTTFAQDIGDMADNVTKSANKLGILIQVGGKLGGLLLIFLGVFMHYKAHKEKGQGQSSHGLAVVAWMVGAAAFYAGSVVKTTGNTLWGTGGGDQTTIQISQ